MQKKSILLNSALVFLSFMLQFFYSCNTEKSYKAIPTVDFTEELASLADRGGVSQSDLLDLRKKHGRFFDLWFYEIADFKKYGPLPDSIQAVYLSEFVLRNSIRKHFAQYPNLKNNISQAFGKLNEQIGNVQAPAVYPYFSQFSNYNTFIDTNKGKTILAYSSEMFLNDTFPLYKLLEVPEFYNRYNGTDQIPAMLLWNYLKGRFEGEGTNSMLEEAIFNGKIWYTMEQVLGDEKIWYHLGYTEKEWNMMVTQEGQIWRHYLNENALFSTEFNHYKRYFTYGNRTFGAGIPEDCPPLIGNFTGYRIVLQMMEKKEMTLQQLWAEKDAAKILKISGYNPLK
jgi:hypothetical protein